MGISGVQFSANGKLTSHRNPGSFSDNVYDAGSAGAVSAGNAVIIGDSTGGDPFTLYCFGSDGAAGEVLGSGALREGVRAAFNPGGGFKPQKIYAMSVNTKKKASLELSNKMKLIAGMYGISGNNLKFKFDKDDENNTFNVYLKNKLESVLEMTGSSHKPLIISNYTNDNIEVRIGNESLTISRHETISEPEATQGQTINNEFVFSFETYSTVEELVEAINETFASGEIETSLSTSAKSSDLSCNLDTVTKTISASDSANFSSNCYYLKNLLQSTGFIEVDDTLTTAKELPDSMSSFTPLTGGDNGECTVLEYARALELLKKENIQLISTTSEEEVVHLLIKSHCEECNSRTGKRERQAIVGGAWGEGVKEISERAKMLGSEYVALCSPGYCDYDYTDPLRKRMKNYSSAFYACKMLGQQASMEVGEPSTKKEVSHFGWEKEYSDTEIDSLIENGVWVGEKETDEYGTTRFQTARSITTSKEDNILLVEFSVIREELYMSRDLRAAVNTKTIGVKGLDSLTASQETRVRQRLDDYQRRGLLRIWDKNSVKLTVDGDVTKIEWSGCPAVPNNFNFITNKYTVYRSAADDS